MTQVLQLKAVTGCLHCALLGMGQHTPELVNGTGLKRTTTTTLVAVSYTHLTLPTIDDV